MSNETEYKNIISMIDRLFAKQDAIQEKLTELAVQNQKTNSKLDVFHASVDALKNRLEEHINEHRYRSRTLYSLTFGTLIRIVITFLCGGGFATLIMKLMR